METTAVEDEDEELKGYFSDAHGGGHFVDRPCRFLEFDCTAHCRPVKPGTTGAADARSRGGAMNDMLCKPTGHDRVCTTPTRVNQ